MLSSLKDSVKQESARCSSKSENVPSESKVTLSPEDEMLMEVTEALRLGLVEAAERGEITNREGAQGARLSLRQFKRLRQRYRERGPRGLVHGNRGRASRRRLPADIRAQIEGLLRSEARPNDSHLRDLLAEKGVHVSVEAVRQMRRRLGLAPSHRRRLRRSSARREAAVRVGALVPIGGSPFRCFAPDLPVYSLLCPGPRRRAKALILGRSPAGPTP